MKNKNFRYLLMALVAMSFFKTPLYAQAEKPRAFSPKIKTPNTSQDLKEDTAPAISEESVEEPTKISQYPSSSAPRKLQQHGLGIGLGQTFLFGNYGKHGEDKITMDLLYTYAASYSFDLLMNAHISEHKNENERMKVMGLTTSIKGRFVEYDNFSPYFVGGLGFYAPRAKREHNNGESQKWTKQKVTFGLNFGGGLDLRLNDHYVVGVLGQMHWPFVVQQDNQSDLRGYYFKLLITGMYLF
jgi:opacity protein-like surface antigen